MIELGDLQHGQEVPVVLQCHDGTSPVLPDVAPVLSLFQEGALVLRRRMPLDAQADEDGVFRYMLFINAAFTVSQVSGFVQWVVDGNPFSETVFFRILPGGAVDGSVISLEYVRRPQAGYLLWESDAGVILRGTNPRSIR